MKPNNLIALFVVVILLVAGLVLGAINQKSEPPSKNKLAALQSETTSPGPEPEPAPQTKDVKPDAMEQIALIYRSLTQHRSDRTS